MPTITTREGFKDHCMRRLGWPVIKVNVDDDQVDDRVDEALEFWHTFHDEGSEHKYISYQIQALDITNKYIVLPDPVRTVYKAIRSSGTGTRSTMWDIQYQMRLSDIWDMTDTTFTYWYLVNRKLREMEIFFTGETPIDFNRSNQKIYIYIDWTQVRAGDWFVFEVAMDVDPEEQSAVWNERMLQKYATVLLKEQWGSVMKKHSNVQLLGGVVMSGQELYNEAKEERLALETEIRQTFETPPSFICG